jgi:hypothetical protein
MGFTTVPVPSRPRLDAAQQGLRRAATAHPPGARAVARPWIVIIGGGGGGGAAAQEQALRDAGGPCQAQRGRHLRRRACACRQRPGPDCRRAQYFSV